MEIIGLDKLGIKLDKLSKVNLSNAITKCCFLVESDAKKECPVDTGALRGSITSEIEANEGYVGTNLEYAPYVEFGTGIFASKGDGREDAWSYQDMKGVWHKTNGSHPQPFLKPALDMNRKRIVEIFQDEVRKTIND